MAAPDEAPFDDGLTSVSRQRSRLFWTMTALAIAAMLLLCTALILIAATRG